MGKFIDFYFNTTFIPISNHTRASNYIVIKVANNSSFYHV